MKMKYISIWETNDGKVGRSWVFNSVEECELFLIERKKEFKDKHYWIEQTTTVTINSKVQPENV